MITGPAEVVSALVCFFDESTMQPERRSGMRKSGKREAGRGKRGRRNRGELSIGGVANVERQYDESARVERKS
ncbi:MAG: hypothetical protein DMD63_09010 [Gemmatimonadetes bacterium]|nr:MAG: hypothetical protein DMD63_09010 [Gemmatimonadota bacterium]